jgi:GNAT superfamily N-acetyltransferase
MVRYTEDVNDVDENMLEGFFVGWPRRPSKAQHLAVLRGSFRVVIAIDEATGKIVGFVNMISDGVLTAFIPWLEVLPKFQSQGIGTELMRRVLDCQQMYSIDLVCDEPLLPYYARLGMTPIPGAGLRRTSALRLSVRSEYRVVISASTLVRVSVHERRDQARHRVQQIVLGPDCHFVCLERRRPRIDDDLTLGPQLVSGPAHPYVANAEDARRRRKHFLGPLDDRRVDSVHQAPVNVPSGLPEHGDDGHGDEQPHDGIRPRPAERHPSRSQQNGERRIAVCTSMQPVGHQRGGADLAAHPHAISGDNFVAGETHDRGAGNSRQVRGALRVNQPTDRLPGDQD